MRTKRALGSCLKSKSQKKKNNNNKGRVRKQKFRSLPIARPEVFLLVLAALGALGSLAGGAAGIAKAVSDEKTYKAALTELKRHNLALEGKRLFLKPYKGKEVTRKTNFLYRKKKEKRKKK